MDKYTCIDLRNYTNSIFILEEYKLFENINIDFDSTKNMILKIKDIKFTIYNMSEDKYFNITCRNQNIKPLARKYSKLHILGYSIHSNWIEQIRCKYSDGSIFYVNLKIGNCTSISSDVPLRIQCEFGSRNYGERIISIKHKGDGWRNIYYCCLDISNSSIELDEITIPSNYYMKILAITLEI